MRASKIFISAPLALDWSTVTRFKSLLKKKGFEVKCWDRKHYYDESLLNESDAVVFLLPDNSFKCSESSLPIGLRAELSRAYALDKPLFVGYIRSSDGQAAIYEAEYNGKFIGGKPSTADSLFNFEDIRFSLLQSINRGKRLSMSAKDIFDLSEDLSKKGRISSKDPVPNVSKKSTDKILSDSVIDERLTLML